MHLFHYRFQIHRLDADIVNRSIRQSRICRRDILMVATVGRFFGRGIINEIVGGIEIHNHRVPTQQLQILLHTIAIRGFTRSAWPHHHLTVPVKIDIELCIMGHRNYSPITCTRTCIYNLVNSMYYSPNGRQSDVLRLAFSGLAGLLICHCILYASEYQEQGYLPSTV